MGSIGANKSTATAPKTEAERRREMGLSPLLPTDLQAPDRLTRNFTPEMFVGDVGNEWMGSLSDLEYLARQNMPKTLDISGVTFRQVFNVMTEWESHKRGNDVAIAKIEYQTDEKIGGIYPILQVNVRVTRTRSGKIKAEIARESNGIGLNATRFV